jgi:hypothetical protein
LLFTCSQRLLSLTQGCFGMLTISDVHERADKLNDPLLGPEGVSAPETHEKRLRQTFVGGQQARVKS